MPCDPFVIKDDQGNVVGSGFVCSRGRKRKACRFCGANATKLCDAPLRGAKQGKTCDAPMCDRCAVKHPRWKDIDLCPPHARAREREQREMDEARAWLEALIAEESRAAT